VAKFLSDAKEESLRTPLYFGCPVRAVLQRQNERLVTPVVAGLLFFGSVRKNFTGVLTGDQNFGKISFRLFTVLHNFALKEPL